MTTVAPTPQDGPIPQEAAYDLMPLLADGSTPALLQNTDEWQDGTVGWEGLKKKVREQQAAAAPAKPAGVLVRAPGKAVVPLAMTSAEVQSDKPWYLDPSVLWREGRWVEFFPGRSMSDAERLNAVVRFSLLASAVISLYHKSPQPALVGLGIVAVLTYLFAAERPRAAEAFAAGERPSSVQAGRAGACTTSTPDNPWKNILPGDKLPRAPACVADEQEVLTNFEIGLPRELGDVYGPRGFPQQYGTLPSSTGIPDTASFKDFLFGEMKTTCKQNPAQCGGDRLSSPISLATERAKPLAKPAAA